MEIHKLLIADHSPLFCMSLCEALGSSFQLLCCHDGNEALALLDRERPDLLVVDLTLPGTDGLTLLRNAMTGTPRPHCLVTTRFLSPFIEDALQELEVDYVMLKPCDAPSVAKRLLELDRAERTVPTHDLSIANTLVSLDVSPKLHGFPCLELAVDLYIRCPGLSITKELYPAVGRELRRSTSSVERSIRSCIHGAWDHRNENIWRLYLPADRTGHIPRPSNATFIAAVAEHLREIQERE